MPIKPGIKAAIAACVILAAGMLMPTVAAADPPCGRGWRKGEWCGPGPRHHRRDWRHDRHGRRGPPPGYRRGYGYPPPPPVVAAPGGIGIFIPFR